MGLYESNGHNWFDPRLTHLAPMRAEETEHHQKTVSERGPKENYLNLFPVRKRSTHINHHKEDEA